MGRRLKTNPPAQEQKAWESLKGFFSSASTELRRLGDEGKFELQEIMRDVELDALQIRDALKSGEMPSQKIRSKLSKMTKKMRAAASDIRDARGIRSLEASKRRAREESKGAPKVSGKKKLAKLEEIGDVKRFKASDRKKAIEAGEAAASGLAVNVTTARKAIDVLTATSALERTDEFNHLIDALHRNISERRKRSQKHVLLEGKTGGVRWKISIVEVKWDQDGKPTKWALMPQIEKTGVTIIPPSGHKEGDEFCIRYNEKTGECTKSGVIPRIYTNELVYQDPPRKRAIKGIKDTQRLHPLVPKKLSDAGVKRTDLYRGGALKKDDPDFRYDGETWLDRNVYNMGVAISRAINQALIWYKSNSIREIDKRRMARRGSRKEVAEKHEGASFRPHKKKAKLPSGKKRGKGRVPKELRELRERRRQREQRIKKSQRKAGTKMEKRFFEGGQKMLGTPEENPMPRLTSAEKKKISASDFGLSKKREYPLHTARFARASMSRALADYEDGKITKVECARVFKKGNARISKYIDEATGSPMPMGGRQKNPIFGKVKRADTPEARGSASLSEAKSLWKKFVASAERNRPRWDFLLDSYDLAQNARANFWISKDPSREKGLKEATKLKEKLRENMTEYLFQGDEGDIHVHSAHSWWADLGLRKEPSSMDEVKRAWRKIVSRYHPDKGSSANVDKYTRAQAAKKCAEAYLTETSEGRISNPPKAVHKKRGLQYLKKSQAAWTKFYNNETKADLMAAYKWLVLAEQELKDAGDKKNLAEARQGLRAATAEMKKRIK